MGVIFIGVGKSAKNERAITFLENVVLNPNDHIDRVLLCGSETFLTSSLVTSFLSLLSFQGYRVKYFREEDIIEPGIENALVNSEWNIIALDGLFSHRTLTEDQMDRLHDFLNAHQHSYLVITTPLSPDEIFSSEIINMLDEGITWSRTFLGCKQLFMDIEDHNTFLELCESVQQSLDYRLRQTIDFLRAPIKPYDDFDGGFTREDVRQAILSGNDARHNVLTVDTFGRVSLRDLTKTKGDKNIAVWLEAYMAGNGYVGTEPDKYDLDNSYCLLLDGYLAYLDTDEPQFRDLPHSGLSEKELVSKIRDRLRR